MQGQQGPSKEWFPSQELAGMNGNGRHRPAPQRPPGMVHLDQPPAERRVARPQRPAPSPGRRRRRFLILGGLFIVCGLFACVIGYAVVNLFNASSTSAGGATAASDFLTAISNGDYDHAYTDLGAAITVQITREEFIQQAQNDDRCYGPVTGYTEVPGSATIQDNTQSYSYTITRKKLAQSYQLRLTLQQDSNGNWVVTSYGNSLGPQQHPCA
jgi:hypothetical protein